MTEPICLVESSLRVNPAALALLRKVTGPLHVVGIFGPKGTGKSFLMDQLAEQKKGFGATPGIWMQLLPHPTKRDETLVLLDTEGLPEQMEEEEEEAFSRLFCLDVLLCSIFIYNTKCDGEPQTELDRLICVRELANKVRILEDCPSENSFLLSSILPEFVWCLRDVASDSVWEEILQTTNHNMDILLSPTADSEDTPANCIQRLFPSQKAFCFRSPHVDEYVRELFESHTPHPIFQKQLEAFKEYILSKGPKRCVNGEILSSRLEQFVAALSRNEPILLEAVLEGSEAAFTWEDYESFAEPIADFPGAAPERRETPGISLPSVWEPKSPLVSKHFLPPSWTFTSTAEANDMKEPMCFIENNPGKKLQVNQEALEILKNIQQPVVVVAIVGLYRTGKSYLMNRLAGKNKGGFSLGATVQANTKGIWMWCRPHPLRPDHTLVLLDTEGLGDVEKSNPENDSWIFALSVLLCSTFVYNSMGTINHYALEQLHFVTELTEHIKVKASAKKSCEREDRISDAFAWFFPTFVWVVRDFVLQLELEDGRSITEDEYLENSLQRRKDTTEKQDLPKKYLRQYFPVRKCFVFDCPAPRKKLKNLEDLPESELSPEFLEQARSFCHYIFENAQAKVVQGGRLVTGAFLGKLAETYVDAIRRGAVPCVENAVLVLAQTENSAAVGDAMLRYEAMVDLLLTLPTEDMAELLEVHARCEEEAIQVFMDRAFKDEGQEHQRKLMNQLRLKLEELCHWNEQASWDRCQAVLTELFQQLEDKIASGNYSVPGGYQQFMEDQQQIVTMYHMVPEKGLRASEALQEFLKSKETAAKSILQADQNLTNKQKEIEAEKARAEASKQEAELQRRLQQQTEQMAREKERSFEEHKRQLMAKMEEDRMKLIADHEKILSQRIQEQSRLQKEGFHQEVSRLQGEIQSLRASISQNRSSGPTCVIS
ncbi:guanylate-binding protein 1-like [Elgaria multicarinata webbii]|uniref:guanylate-binding protein 1-like n=1 Tax=Elgaria multicarinata webbii TaxID=159646 RepID=UPI002FCD3F91